MHANALRAENVAELLGSIRITNGHSNTTKVAALDLCVGGRRLTMRRPWSIRHRRSKRFT